MAWIEVIEPERADGPLAKLYATIAKARGRVAAVHRAQSLHPRALRAHLDLYKAVVLGPGSLSRVDRERIAVVVSFHNGCEYCIRHHGEALRQLGDAPEVAADLERGVVPISLDEARRALLEWAAKGTATPARSSPDAVRRLRELGWDDRAILDATLTVAYFNFVNRLVLLLGVELEEGFEATCGADPTEPG
jgi:uncharacterized peroxidase-related enzyme